MWWLPALVVLAVIGSGYVAAVLLLVVVSLVKAPIRRPRPRDTWVVVDLTPRDMTNAEKP